MYDHGWMGRVLKWHSHVVQLWVRFSGVMKPRVVGWWVLSGIVQIVGSIFYGVMNQWVRAWNGAVQVMGSISCGKKAKSGWMVGL